MRELSQSGLHPANCRLLDAAEAWLTGRTDGKSLLVLGFESAHHPVDAWMELALECAREHGGEAGELKGGERSEKDGDAVEAWRQTFLRAPYLRDTFVAIGVLSDTFETAITWDRFPEFHANVMETARRAVAEVSGRRRGPRRPRVSCRFTHVYPDGPAPYFTILAPAKRGGEVEQWDEIKAAASDAVIDRRRHDHPPPRGRPRPPALVRPPAPGPVRRRAARGEGGGRPGRDPEPGRADRPLGPEAQPAMPEIPRLRSMGRFAFGFGGWRPW